MIKEFSIHPKPRDSKAKIIFLTALSVAAFAVLTSFMVEQKRGIIGLVAVVAITYALYIYTKYVSVDYYYDITLIEGEAMFIVRQKIGKRNTTLCRMALTDVKKIELEDKEARKAHKTPAGFVKYVYVPSISPVETIRITVSSRYEKFELVIEGGAELAELLNDYVKEAREMLSDDEDYE